MFPPVIESNSSTIYFTSSSNLTIFVFHMFIMISKSRPHLSNAVFLSYFLQQFQESDWTY